MALPKGTVVETFRDLIACWPTIADFAREIDVGYEAARKMNERNRVSNEHWDAVIEAAATRGMHVTADDLHKMGRQSRANQRRRRPEPRPQAA